MDDPSPNRRTTAFDICHSLWPGFGRATTRAHPAGAPGCGSSVHDLFSVRNMFYFQAGNVVYEIKAMTKLCGRGRTTSANATKTPKKTNASPRGEAQVMGGFPKRSGVFIQNLRVPIQPPSLIISSHAAGHRRVGQGGGPEKSPPPTKSHLPPRFGQPR